MNRKQKSANLLCIFSRYPREGRCKTRLIPELGAKGATALQLQMTAHIIKVAGQADCDILLFVEGGSDPAIQDWLGPELDYVQQQGDGLGARMAHGFDTGFSKGYDNILLVGADCPAIDAPLLNGGFAALASSDLVFGPTVDGGYYLVGMGENHPEIFSGIEWGSDQVMAQTLAVAGELDVSMLARLHDVDTPADLAHLPDFLKAQRL